MTALLLVTAACGEREVTYHQTIRPLVEQQCAGCHDGNGIAPFTLASYAEVKALGDTLRVVTESRTMPPWGVDNSGACNTFSGARWLSDDAIDDIRAWVDQGTPEGDAATAVSIAAVTPATIAPTATLELPEAYTPRAGMNDDYRCFIVDPGLSAEGFLTAFEVKPGDAAIVHHVILFTADTERVEQAAERFAAREPEPGYTCFGGPGLSPQSSRMVAGWAPGTTINRYPDGTGIRLPAGRKLIMQVHYNIRDKRGPDRTRVDIEVAADVERRAEILPLADLSMQIAPGQALVWTEPLALPVPGIGGFVRGVFPHMHELGKKMKARIIHADRSDTCLTDVPAWDFNWQQAYFLERPQYLLSTDRIEITCGYDTRSRTKPVRWGDGTEDEMCLLGLFITLN